MLRTTLRRASWRQTKNGAWTCSLGERGTRIRLFQKRRGGVFYRSVWIAGEGRHAASIHTRDREEALRLGRQLLGELLRGGAAAAAGELPLEVLWHRYSRECAEFLDNKSRTRSDAEARIRIWFAVIGRDRDVRTLSALDLLDYGRKRRAGGIVLGSLERTKAVGARSVDADYVLLRHMLRWACTVVIGSGRRLLDRHPLAGVPRVRELNPRRPVASQERFLATREAIVRLTAEAKHERERMRWTKLELALVLAEATGRRLGAICALRWDDVDFVRRTICWRAEHDKKGFESILPLPDELLTELREFQRRMGTIGGLVFASEQDSTRHMDRYLFDKWLVVAERAGNIPKLQGSLWHAYRRKWASERKHHALVDVAKAGGWKGTTTLLQVYQQPDDDAVLKVLNEPRRRHEPGSPPPWRVADAGNG